MCTAANLLYRMSQELRSIFWDLIPELMLSQKRHIHMGPICSSSGFMSFWSTLNKLERKEEQCAFIGYDVKYTVTDSLFNTQASCSKCPLSAWINFLTHMTTELITLRSNAALLMLLAALRICWSSSLCVGFIVEENVTNHMGVWINPKAQFQPATHVCRFKMLNALDMVCIHSVCV